MPGAALTTSSLPPGTRILQQQSQHHPQRMAFSVFSAALNAGLFDPRHSFFLRGAVLLASMQMFCTGHGKIARKAASWAPNPGFGFVCFDRASNTMRSHGAKEPMKHACCMAAWASSCPERRMRAKPTFRWIKGWFLGRMYAHMRAQWVFTHEPVRSVKLWSLFPFSNTVVARYSIRSCPFQAVQFYGLVHDGNPVSLLWRHKLFPRVVTTDLHFMASSSVFARCRHES